MADATQLNELFYQAGTLMLVGMAFVFAFLMLMIFVIQFIITPLGKKYGQEVNDQQNSAKVLSSNEQPNEPSSQVIAVISAAIKKYRSK